MVPFPKNPKFVGRHDQIKQLRALISDPNGPRELAITGLGGAGKTQVALELAYQIRDADPDCSILWIPCTSQENVEQAYTEIARRLQLPGRTDAKARVQAYLSQSTSKKWILIFDNADSEHMWMKGDKPLRTFIPDNERGRTLYTSRNGQLAIDLADSYIIEISEFDAETGKEFLQRSLLQQHLLNDHDTVVRFFEKLTFLPLAIAQAVAYINKNKISLSAYMELLEKQETEIIEVLSENFQDKWRYKDVNNPVATAWWISFQQIQQSSPLAAEYLSFMSCINPRDIPQFMLPPASSDNEKIKAIGLLKSYAFVSDSEPAEDKLLTIHRLVHLATRNWMRIKTTLEPQMLTIVDNLIIFFLEDEASTLLHFSQRSELLLGVIPYGEKLRVQCLPHALALLRERFAPKEQDKQILLMFLVVKYLGITTRYEEAEDLLTQFLRHSNINEDDDCFSLHILSHLAVIYDFQRRPQTKKEVLGQFLDRPKTILLKDRISKQLQVLPSTSNEGANSAIMETRAMIANSILSCQSLLASLYARVERYRESENLHLCTIKKSSEILGPDHPMTLEYQACLADMYGDSQQSTKAEEIYLRIIKTISCARDTDHSVSMRYRDALASIYCKTGQYSDAEQSYVQLIESSKAIHGPRHIRTLNYQFTLAEVYRHLKRYKDAEELMIFVIKTKQLMLGSKVAAHVIEHLSVLITLYVDWGHSSLPKELSTQVSQYREHLAEVLPLRHKFQKLAHASMVQRYAVLWYAEIIPLNKEILSLNKEIHSLKMSLLKEEMGAKERQLNDPNERVAILKRKRGPLEEKLLSLQSKKSCLQKERSSLEEEGISWKD